MKETKHNKKGGSRHPLGDMEDFHLGCTGQSNHDDSNSLNRRLQRERDMGLDR